MISLKTIAFLVSFYVGTIACFSQEIRFERITIDAGYSQNTFNCIFQDHNGFLWMGTQDGLNRYDGYEFKVYRHDPLDSNSLSHSWIWDIEEDQYHELWIATWRGLNKFNPYTGENTRYLTHETDSNAISGDRPTSVVEDKFGKIWIGTWGGGLSRFDPESNIFQSFVSKDNEEFGLPSNLIRTLYLDDSSRLWIGTWNGLARIDELNAPYPEIRNLNHIHPNYSLDGIKITSISILNHTELWLGSIGNGVFKFDLSVENAKQYTHSSSKAGSISSNDIASIYVDKSGELWVGTISDGINLYLPETNTFQSIKHSDDDLNSISGDQVLSIYEDQSGIVWFGANGLNKYDRRLKRFNHFRHKNNDDQSLGNNQVRAFCDNGDGKIWIGTDQGINLFDPQSRAFQHFGHNAEYPNSLSDNNITALVKDKAGKLWIGTSGGGLNYMDVESKKITRYSESVSSQLPEGINYITSLLLDKDGQLWISTFYKGIIRLHPKTMQVRHYQFQKSDTFTLPGNYVLCLYQDSKGAIWAGTWGAGLCKYLPDKDGFITYANNLEDQTSLKGNIVEALFETIRDEERYLWVGTNSGLSVAKLDKGEKLEFTTYSDKEGLPANVIYGIMEDDHGDLWFSTTNGLCRFDTRDSIFRSFNVNDGLQSNEFNGGACLKTNAGQLLFGGINGFNMFSPEHIQPNEFVPNIIFTTFNVLDNEYTLGNNLNYPEPVRLNHKQNFFSFEFACMDFTAPQSNQFAYMLTGIDESWVDAQNRRYARYTDVDPGIYEFKVKTAKKEGGWHSNEARMRLEIIPPFWQTWWFRILVVFILLSLVYLFHRYRIQKILELERLRVRIASDLHDDFGAALTRIAIHSEQIQNSDDQTKIKAFSQKIGEISRAVINSMSDIVWSIDARNDTVKDLIDRMHSFCGYTLAPLNINVDFTSSGLKPNKHISVNIRQNLYYIFKEAINNTVKYAHANRVKVQLRNEGNHFHLAIIDNGIGFNPKEVKMGNGLRNMKMRADRMHFKLDILQDKGTCIVLEGDKI